MPTVREHILSLRDQGHDMEFIRGRIKYLTGVDPTNASRSLLDVEVSEEDVNLAAGADEIKATLSSVERPDREQLRRKVSGTPDASPDLGEALMPEFIQDIPRAIHGDPLRSPIGQGAAALARWGQRSLEDAQAPEPPPLTDPRYQQAMDKSRGGGAPEALRYLPLGQQLYKTMTGQAPAATPQASWSAAVEAQDKPVVTPKKWALRVAGRAAGAAEGAVASLGKVGEDLSDLVDEFARAEHAKIRRQAQQARAADPDAETVDVVIDSGMAFGREPETIKVKIDDLMDADTIAGADLARFNDRSSSLKSAYKEYSSSINKMLENDPALLSTHTLKFWREGTANLISDLGQLAIYFGGSLEDPGEEDGMRGLNDMERLQATRAAAKAMGMNLTDGAMAGFAFTALNPIDAIQAEGPPALLDILPFASGVLSAARRGAVELPDGMLQAADKIVKEGSDIARSLRDAPVVPGVQIGKTQVGGSPRSKGGTSVGDVYNMLRRQFVDAASNVEKNATATYDEIAKWSSERQGRLQTAIERVAAEAGEGGVRLGEREKVVNAEHGILESEGPRFNREVERVYEEKLRESKLMPHAEMDIPDAVRERVAQRLGDDFDRTSYVVDEEIEVFLQEGGELTKSVVMPGTKKEGAVTHELDVNDAALWDQINREKDALKEDILNRVKNRGMPKKAAGKGIASIEVSRKKELTEVINKTHPAQRQRMAVSGDKLKKLRQEAEAEAAEKVKSSRSPFGVRGSVKPYRVPVSSAVYKADVTIDPQTQKVFYKTPSMKEIRKYEASIKDKTPDEQRELMAQFLGEGQYLGVERRVAGEDVVTPLPEYSANALRVIENVVNQLADTPNDRARARAEIDANIGRSIDDALLEVMRSDAARQKAAAKVSDIVAGRTERLEGKMSKRQRDKLAKNVYVMLSEMVGRKTPESGAPGSALPHDLSFNIMLPGGKRAEPITLREVMGDVMKKDTPLSRRVMSESIRQTAMRMGIREAEKTAQRAYLKEIDKGWETVKSLGRTKPVPETEAVRAIATLIDSGSLPSMLLARPSDIGGILAVVEGTTDAKALNGFVSQVRKATGKKHTADEVVEIAKQARDRILRYEDLYTPKYDAARDIIRAGDTLYDAERFQKDSVVTSLPRARREVEVRAVPTHGFDKTTGAPRGFKTGSVYIQKNLAAGLNNFGKARKAVEQASIMMRATTFAKSRMTAQQLTTLKNNVLSNVFLQSIRRGSALVLPKLLERLVRYKKWEKGDKSLSEADVTMFDNLGHRVSPDMTDVELGGLGSKGVTDYLLESGAIGFTTAKALRALGLPMRKAEEIYKFSDDAFKIDEGIHSWEIISQWEDWLRPGDELELMVGKNKKVAVRKRSDGRLELGNLKGWRKEFVPTGKILDADQWNAIKGQASMLVADNLFVNFSDVPDWARILRSTPVLPAVASPFYTWLNAAMDNPLLGKKGLIAHSMSASPYVYTTNKQILGSIFARQAGVGAAVNVIDQGSQTAPYDETMLRDMRNVQGWGKHEQAAIINSLDRGQLRSYPLTQANPFSASSLAMRAAEQGLYSVDRILSMWGEKSWTDEHQDLWEGVGKKDFIKKLKAKDFKDLEGVPEEEAKDILLRRKWLMEHGTGQTGMTLSDGLDFIGMAGNPLLEIMNVAMRAEQQGKPVSWSNVAKRYAIMMMGGTYANFADVVIGGMDPTSSLTSRYIDSRPIDGEKKQFLEWAMREVTGIGWKRTNLIKRTPKYYETLQEYWDDSIAAPVADDAKILKRRLEELVLADRERVRPETRMARDAYAKAAKRHAELKAIIKAVMTTIKADSLRRLRDSGLLDESKKAWR